MANAIQAPQDASPETQAILKELQAEGHEISGMEPEKKVETPVTPAEPAKPLEKTPEQLEAERVAAEEAGKKTEKPNREEKFVPVGKHTEERHKRQEAETRAEKAEREAAELRAQLAATNKPNTEQISDVRTAATALAEKHGLDADLVNELLETSKKLMPQGLSKEVEADLAAVKQLRADAEARARETAQETGFSNEFTSILKEFPELADRKEDLKQLAFSEGNINTSLRRIALEYIHDNPPDKPGRRTAEAPTHGTKAVEEVIDFAEISEEDFKKLTYEQMDQYQTWRAKNGK